MSIEQLFSLLTESQHQDYIGEEISQLEHGLQAAHFSKEAGASDEVVIACLLHDIGHLCEPNAPKMDEWGVKDHEKIGADYLRKMKFPEKVCVLVDSHVKAKRYLVSTNENYYKNLSDASLETLKRQGGKMTASQVEEFEADPLFDDILLVRRMDEVAKRTDIKVDGLETYRPIIERMINI